MNWKRLLVLLIVLVTVVFVYKIYKDHIKEDLKNKPISEHREYYDNGIMKNHYYMLDSLLYGKYYKLYPSGNIKSEENYINGISHGIKTFYEDTKERTVKMSITYINGQWKLQDIYKRNNDILWHKNYYLRGDTALLLAINTYDRKNGKLIRGKTPRDVSNYCEVITSNDTIMKSDTYLLKVKVNRHCENSLLKISASCSDYSNIALEDTLLLGDTIRMFNILPNESEMIIKLKSCTLGHNLVVGKIYEFCKSNDYADINRVMFFSKEFYVKE